MREIALKGDSKPQRHRTERLTRFVDGAPLN
jgi:hypothetical protein